MSHTDTTSEPGQAIDPLLRGDVRHAPGPDGIGLAYRYWGAALSRAAAVYLHGIAGHSLWFSAAASRLAEAGISIYGPDRRGSGLNRELGPGHLSSYEVVLRDIRYFVDLARSEHRGLPVFLLAGCWGAKPGVVFAARHGDLLAGLALIAPALSVRVTLPPKDLAGVALSLVTQPMRRFPIPLRAEQYTENARFRAFVAADPDRLLEATARFFFETARLDRLAARAPAQLTLPVLLLLGGRDAIVKVDGLQAWFERIGSTDRTLKLYPEFAHILEFEDEWERYLTDLLAWLEPRLSAPRSPAGGA